MSGLGRGAAAMVSRGSRSVTVGRVASGMETETQGFRLGVCLSKTGRSWVSVLPRPNAVDVVTLLCLLPAPAVASRDGGTAEPAAPCAAPCGATSRAGSFIERSESCLLLGLQGKYPTCKISETARYPACEASVPRLFCSGELGTARPGSGTSGE